MKRLACVLDKIEQAQAEGRRLIAELFPVGCVVIIRKKPTKPQKDPPEGYEAAVVGHADEGMPRVEVRNMITDACYMAHARRIIRKVRG